PEAVVVADASAGARPGLITPSFGCLLFHGSRFLVRQKVFACERIWTLQGSSAAEVPYSPQVRLAPLSTGHGVRCHPRRLRRGCAALAGERHRQYRRGHDQYRTDRQRKRSTAHLKPPFMASWFLVWCHAPCQHGHARWMASARVADALSVT